jgi:AhpD family alkylhydroperoxidase
MFPEHTLESAPTEAHRSIQATINKQGYLPAAVARMATSPQLLDGFLRLSGLFETSTLDPVAREVVIMTMATRNSCHLCVAMHTAKLTSLGADPEIIAALRSGTPLRDSRLEAVRAFVHRVLATSGDIDDPTLSTFLDAGFTHRNALEVVMGIGTYTMSTLANRLTKAPIDGPLLQFA